MNLDRVNDIIDHYQAERTNALAILQDIQREYNHLPREALVQVAQQLTVPLGEIYGLATFFRAFSLEPKGKHVCKVCLGTACHVRGGPRILEALERELGIDAGQTTADGRFSLETVRCLGACALAPIIVVDEEPQASMTPDKATRLVAELDGGQRQPNQTTTEPPARSSSAASTGRRRTRTMPQP